MSALAENGGTLEQGIRAILGRPEFRHARFGAEFRALDTGQPIFRMNEQQFFVPGSTTKLLTEGTALSLLGPDYRFHTRVFRTGSVDANGMLKGNLILVASGDPNLSNRLQPDGTLAFQNIDHSYDSMPGSAVVPGDPLAAIRDLAAQVAKAGIKRVDGRVIVDVSLFPQGVRELGTGVVISPIIVNDNVIDLAIAPGAEGSAPQIKTSPETAYLRITNQVKTGAAGSKFGIRIVSDVPASDGSHTVTVSGTVPAGPSIHRTYRVPEPSVFAQTVLTEALKELGVAITGNANSSNSEQRTEVADHVSAPFREEVKVTLKVSQNLHASMTPYLLGATVGTDHDHPLQSGFDAEHKFLQGAGLDVSGASQSDGAGGDAFYTPAFMVEFLVYMSKQPFFSVFYSALPTLGKDGTLWDIQQQSPAAGFVHAKTGTYGTADLLNKSLMVTGKGIAGYIDRKDGRRLAFAAYINMVDGDPETIAHRVGDALGEIAALAYDAPIEH